MLRRKLSAGLLTQRSVSTAPGIIPASPQASRTFASSASHFSQNNGWKNETVATIKAELKKRGLSQSGNKSTLIERLSSAEITSSLPPLPSPLRSSPLPNTRSLSTTVSVFATPKKAPSPPKAAKKVEVEEPISTDTVTSAGPEVSTSTVEAPSKEALTKEELTVAPGLPETAAVELNQDAFQVQMPGHTQDVESEQVIPFTPDNFRSNEALAETVEPKSESSTEEVLPKIMTVASASTHLSGGPVHGNFEATDSHTHDNASEGEPLEVLPSVRNFVSSTGDIISNFYSIVPEVNLPKSGKPEDFKPIKKELDSEEKRGAWVLGGIVALALLIGGPGKSDKEKEEAKSGKGKSGGKDGEKKLGDATWEKASGAGVVGHGARKD